MNFKVGNNASVQQAKLNKMLGGDQKPTADEVIRRMDNLTAKGELSPAKGMQLQKMFQQLPEADQALVEQFVAKKLDTNPELGAITCQVAEPVAKKPNLELDKDKTTQQQVVQGAKTKANVGADVASKTKSQLDQLQVEGRTGAAVSKKQFTPQAMVARELTEALSKNHPNAAAATKAMSTPVSNLVQKTMMEMAKNPEAAKDLAGVVSQISTKEGAGVFAKQVGEAFAKGTGIPPTNPQALSTILNGLNGAAAKFGGDKAPQIAKTLSNVGAKFGVEVGEKAAAKAASKMGGKVATKVAENAATHVGEKVAEKVASKTAEKVGEKVAGKTAEKAATKAAAGAGKAVPGVGNCIAAASTCMGLVKLFKACTTKPRSGEKIAKEGLNTLMQGVGIAFPWVALGGDVLDLGWEAKMAMSQVSKANPEAAKNPELQQQVADMASQQRGLSAQDAAGVLTGPAQLLQATLSGAGNKKAADAVGNLAGGANAIANNGGNLKDLQGDQLDAFMQSWNAASSTLGKEAAVEENPTRKQQMEHLSHGFGQLFQAAYKHKKMKGAEGPKREDLKADVVNILKDVSPTALQILDEEIQKQKAAADQQAQQATQQTA